METIEFEPNLMYISFVNYSLHKMNGKNEGRNRNCKIWKDDIWKKLECLKLIGPDKPTSTDEFRLSFEPSQNLPCMANVLKIAKDGQGDYGLFANEDIDVGQTVVLEKAFLTYLFMRHTWKCNICLKENANLMPCERCTAAMFCSDECKGHPLHMHECGLKMSNVAPINGVIMRDVRSCLLAINLFEQVDDLLNFVEQAMKNDQAEEPAFSSDQKLKYWAYLNLPLKLNPTIPQNVSCFVFETYRMLLSNPKIEAMFHTEKSRRFLMHLIGQHYWIAQHNSEFYRIKLPVRINGSDRLDISTQTVLMRKYMMRKLKLWLASASVFCGSVVISHGAAKSERSLKLIFIF